MSIALTDPRSEMDTGLAVQMPSESESGGLRIGTSGASAPRNGLLAGPLPQPFVPARSGCTWQVDVKKASQLTAAEWASWREWHRDNPLLHSPYFHPEFTVAVAAERADVRIAVIQRAGQLCGLLPYQTTRFGIGQPIAGRLSDAHGLICAAESEIPIAEVISACGLKAFDFDQLVRSQPSFQPWTHAVEPSWMIDLSAGYAGFKALKRAAKSDLCEDFPRKLRKIEKELGPVEFEWHTQQADVFDRLVEWKRSQYLATGMTDVLAVPWTVRLLDRLRQVRFAGLEGVLSTLRINGQLTAVHLGMRSRERMHSWFPAYDPAVGRYSPGLALVGLMLQRAADLGIQRIDLGTGSEPYKQRLATGSELVARGSVEVEPCLRMARQGWRTTKRLIRATPLQRAADVPVAWLRRMREWIELR